MPQERKTDRDLALQQLLEKGRLICSLDQKDQVDQCRMEYPPSTLAETGGYFNVQLDQYCRKTREIKKALLSADYDPALCISKAEFQKETLRKMYVGDGVMLTSTRELLNEQQSNKKKWVSMEFDGDHDLNHLFAEIAANNQQPADGEAGINQSVLTILAKYRRQLAELNQLDNPRVSKPKIPDWISFVRYVDQEVKNSKNPIGSPGDPDRAAVVNRAHELQGLTLEDLLLIIERWVFFNPKDARFYKFKCKDCLKPGKVFKKQELQQIVSFDPGIGNTRLIDTAMVKIKQSKKSKSLWDLNQDSMQAAFATGPLKVDPTHLDAAQKTIEHDLIIDRALNVDWELIHPEVMKYYYDDGDNERFSKEERDASRKKLMKTSIKAVKKFLKNPTITSVN